MKKYKYQRLTKEEKKQAKNEFYQTGQGIDLKKRFTNKAFVTSFVATLIYFVFAIDIIPEALFGPIGFLDDAIMIIWMIGNISEELDKYKGPQDLDIRYSKKVYKDPNIIDDADYIIKD